jgi:hypothetical protein
LKCRIIITRRAPRALCFVLLLLTCCCARRASQTSGTGATSPAANKGQAVRVSSDDADAAEPATAAGPDGSVYVAWVEHRTNGEADVMLAHLDSAGHARGEAVRLNSEAGRATAWRGDPPTVAVSRDGIVYVGWTARVESASGHADDLYLSVSHDKGQNFASPVKVNDDKGPAVHGMHSLAVAHDGRLHIAWLDERNVAEPQHSGKAEGHHMESNREVFMAYSTDEGRSFSTNRRVATEVCPCCKTALAIGPDNRLYVSWRQVLPGDFRHIAVASSSDGGEAFSQPVIVSDDRWQIAGCPVSGPSLAVGADGALRVLWYSEGRAGETGLYWSESSDGGRTFAPRRLFYGGQVSGTPVLLNDKDNNFTAVWGEGGSGPSHLVTARLDVEGHVIEDTGASNSELPTAAETGDQLYIAYISKSGDHRSIWLTRKSST